MSDTPETLYSKPIFLVGDNTVIAGQLVCLLSGDDYTVRITHGSSSSEHVAWNLFDALAQVRADLEGEGLRPAVEGASQNVYPSRMAREMGGGRRAYRWPLAGRPVTVDIFDDVPADDYGRLVYVDDQLTWIKERRGQLND